MKVWGKRSQDNGPKTEKDKTERATGLGRRTREDRIEKYDHTDVIPVDILCRKKTQMIIMITILLLLLIIIIILIFIKNNK